MNIANLLTMLRILLIPIFYLCFLSNLDNKDFYATLIFLLASFTDFLDGYLARKYNLITNFGKIMDPLADKLLVMTALITLISVNRVDAWIVIIILARELGITALRVITASEGVDVSAGTLGKLKTVFQMIAIVMLLMNINYGLEILFIALVLTIVSGVDYVIKMSKVIKWM